MKMGIRVFTRAITAVFLGLTLMLTALSATAQNYNFAPDTGTFESIRDNDLATLVSLGTNEDDDNGVFNAITIPFEFYFFGQEITSLVPTTNLWLTTNATFECVPAFRSGNCEDPQEVGLIDQSSGSRSTNHLGAIYPFWTDSHKGAMGQVHYRTTEEDDTIEGDGDRVLTIEFSDFAASWRPTTLTNNLISLQVRLFEANGNIEFLYGPLENVNTAREFWPTFIGIAGSATFLTDSTTTRYYSVQSLASTPTPTASDSNFRTFHDPNAEDIRLPNDEQIYRFTPTPVLLAPDDVSATVGVIFNAELPALIYPIGEVTYGLTGAGGVSLPAGLSFQNNPDMPNFRELSGTPTASLAETLFTYTATDDNGNEDASDDVTLTKTFMLEVNPAPLTSPGPQTLVFVAGEEGTSDALVFTGGVVTDFEEVEYDLPTPSIPAGFTFIGTSGNLDYNIPDNAGDDSMRYGTESMLTEYMYVASDADLTIVPNTFTLEVIDVMPMAPTMMPMLTFVVGQDIPANTELPEFGNNIRADLMPIAENILPSDYSVPTFMYTLMGLDDDGTTVTELPAWLNFNETTRVLSNENNAPVAGESFDVIYTASEGVGRDTEQITFTINVTTDPRPMPPANLMDLVVTPGQVLPNVVGATGAMRLPEFPFEDAPDDTMLTYQLALQSDTEGMSITDLMFGGLTFDPDTRLIHGMVPTDAEGAFRDFIYSVIDDDATPDDDMDDDKVDADSPFRITILDDMPSFASGASIGDIPAIVGSSITHNPLPEVVENSDGIAIGTGMVTYSITPPLPTGLGLTFDRNSRMITGIPTRPLADPDNIFMYIATDEDLDTAMLPFTITVAANTPIVVPDTMQNFIFTIGENISGVDGVNMLAFSGGDTSLTYAIDTAVRGLPNGLSLDPNTAVLSGTPLGTDRGDSFSSRSYTYIATDNKGTATEDDDESERHTFTITMVDERPMAPTPSVTNLYFTPGQDLTGSNVRTLPAITGGSGDLTYALTPSQDLTTRFGLSLDLETNLFELSGSVLPADNDTDNSVPLDQNDPAATFTYTATDEDMDSASATFTIRVVDTRPVLETTIFPYVFTAGVAEPLDLPMFGNNLPQNLPPNSGITEPTFTFTLTGVLPDGITHDMENQQLTSDTSIVATDTDIDLTYRVQETGDADFDEVMLTLSVTDDPTPTPPRSLPPAGYTFTPGEIVNVILPNFTIAGDEDGSMLTHTLANAAGTEIDNSPSASLIGGLMYDQGSRAISGTVDGDDMDNDVAETTYTYSAIVTATPEQTDMTTFTIEIVDDQPVAPASTPDFTFVIGETLSDRAQPPQLPVFSGGTTAPNAPLTYALDATQAQSLMQSYGLTFNAVSRTFEGRVTGTPSPDDVAQMTYSYTATDRDGDEAMADFTITFTDEQPAFATGPTIDPISGTQGTAIQTTAPLPAVESIGSGGITYIFDPLLPNGLSFNQDTRVIFGTPSAGLTETTFTYRARDVDGDRTPQSFSFTITIEATGDPVVMPIVAPTVMDFTFAAGEAVTATPETTLPAFTGGNGALTYTLAVTSESEPRTSVTDLVGGLEFDPSNRQITGTNADTSANENANETYTYTATDSVGDMAMTTFTITITDEDGVVAPPSQQRLTFNPNGEEATMTLDEFTGGSGTLTYSSDDEDEVLMDFGLTFNAAARTISGSIPVGTMSKEMEYTYTATSGNEMGSATFTIAITDVPPLVEVTANAIPTVGANIALVASQAISSRVELALNGLSSGIDIRTLDGPSLRLNPQQQSGGSGSPVRFGVWYSAASDSLSDTRGDVTWSGDTDSTNLGFDVGFDISANASLVVGILQNSSSTSATYRSTATGSTGSGTLSVDLDSTAFYVGLGYDWLDAWFANGSADSTLNDSETKLAIPASFSYQTIGLTASFEIIDSLSVGGKVESLTSDLSLAAMADDPRFDDGLATDSSQLRTAFVANYQLKLGGKGNGLLIPKFEFGFRDLSLGSSITNDATAVGGSAMETGFGVDYIQRAWGLTVGLDMRSISVENYSSDSTQYQIRWESGSYGSGLSFQLTPHSVSETLGGIDSLYSGDYDQYQNLLQRQRGGDSTQDSKGLDFEVGYGFVAGYGTVTPYLKTTNYRGSGNRADEVGLRYQTLSGLELTLTAERSLTPQTIQIFGFPLTFMQQENALTFNTRYSF